MSASDAFTQPILFIRMLFNSYVKYFSKYITGMLGSELAWSEVVLPGYLVIIMFIPLCVVAFWRKITTKLTANARFCLLYP